MIAIVSQRSTLDLPPALRSAQEAIHLPEVQEVLRRLSEFKLGIFMPHRHDEHTGQFRAFPEEVTPVEAGLELSFQSSQDIASQTTRFFPVGCCWRAGALTASALCEMCEMVGDETPRDTKDSPKLKVLKTKVLKTKMLKVKMLKVN